MVGLDFYEQQPKQVKQQQSDRNSNNSEYHDDDGGGSNDASPLPPSSYYWTDMNGTKHEQVDIILGADIICKPSDAVAVAYTIYNCLKVCNNHIDDADDDDHQKDHDEQDNRGRGRGGVAYLISASEKHRFGVDCIQEACANAGLIVKQMKSVDSNFLFGREGSADSGSCGGGSDDINSVFLNDMKKTTGFVDNMDLLFFEIIKPPPKLKTQHP